MDPFKESEYGYLDILNPRNAYASSKRASETLCASYYKQYGVKSCVVRPGHIYGPTAVSYTHLALACDENLRNAVICKVIHAELSVLSLIKLDGIEEKKFISEIKQDLRENSSVVLKDREALKRDKIAIVLLKFGGIKLFRMVFEIYSRVLRNE